MKKSLIVICVLGFMGLLFLNLSSSNKQQSVTSNKDSETDVLNKKTSLTFERAQDGYLKSVQGSSFRVERHYAQNLKTDEQDLFLEEQRQGEAQQKLIAEINDGLAPSVTHEEQELLIEMMAAEGVQSAYRPHAN